MADEWNLDYESSKDLANDSLSLIQVRDSACLSLLIRFIVLISVILILQERNLKHPGGGPEASRITAAIRRKLGTLGTLLDNLRTRLESPDCANM